MNARRTSSIRSMPRSARTSVHETSPVSGSPAPGPRGAGQNPPNELFHFLVPNWACQARESERLSAELESNSSLSFDAGSPTRHRLKIFRIRLTLVPLRADSVPCPMAIMVINFPFAVCLLIAYDCHPAKGGLQ